jgi:four helix bundle protein
VNSDKRARVKSFKDLEIWQRGIKLVEDIYKATDAFPEEEIYGLTSQIRKAAVSIPSNIAEGFARYFKKEYRQFLYVTLGSSAELTTQIVIASKLGYLKEKKAGELTDEIEQISKMTMSLIKKINATN